MTPMAHNHDMHPTEITNGQSGDGGGEMLGPVGTYRLYGGVHLGEGAQIGDYVIIGVPPRDISQGEQQTYIGRNAVIRSHSVIYSGNIIGADLQTGHGVMIRELNDI